jgi:Protein of unknown function (DUF2970)
MAKENAVALFLKSMKAVFWGFLGVRKAQGQEDDMASLSFVHVIIAGVVGVVIFMTTLVLIIKLVLAK